MGGASEKEVGREQESYPLPWVGGLGGEGGGRDLSVEGREAESSSVPCCFCIRFGTDILRTLYLKGKNQHG